MKISRKKILSLGSLITLSAPVVAVVSCGGVKETDQATLENLNKLKSNESLSRIENQWQMMVLHEQDNNFAVNSTEDELFTKVKPTILDNIKRGLMKDKKYLWNIAQSLISNKNMIKEATSQNKTPFALANDWKLLQVASKGKVASAINEKALKMIFKEQRSFRSQIIKNEIIKGFLSNGLNKKEYEKLFLNEDGDSFSDIQDLIKDDKNFLITNEVINQKLFVQFDYELNAKQSQSFISTTLPEKTYSDMVTSLTTGDIKNALKTTFSTTEKVANDELIVGNHANYIAYSGTNALTGTKGILKQDEKEFKKATTRAQWNGFVVDGELLSSSTTKKIPLFPEEGGVVSKTVKVKYVEGIMPIYTSSHLTMEGTSWFSGGKVNDKLINLISQSQGLYDKAKEYYTKRKENKIDGTPAPLLLEILSPDLKDIALKHGFDFIKED